MIPIGVKKSLAQQKFRIPFKNLSTTLDADIDFTFVRVTPNHPLNIQDSEIEDLTPYLEFYCQPGNIKFSPTQQQFLNVLIKVNTVKLATIEASISTKRFN